MRFSLCVIQGQVNMFDILDEVTEIAGFRHGVDVVFLLLGRKVTYVGVCLPTFRDNLWGPIFKGQ